MKQKPLNDISQAAARNTTIRKKSLSDRLAAFPKSYDKSMSCHIDAPIDFSINTAGFIRSGFESKSSFNCTHLRQFNKAPINRAKTNSS